MVKLAWWAFILIILGLILLGGIIGFLVARKKFQDYLEKNPPVNEKMIRAMMLQMGRTPSEKQVRQIMAAMNAAKGK